MIWLVVTRGRIICFVSPFVCRPLCLFIFADLLTCLPVCCLASGCSATTPDRPAAAATRLPAKTTTGSATGTSDAATASTDTATAAAGHGEHADTEGAGGAAAGAAGC